MNELDSIPEAILDDRVTYRNTYSLSAASLVEMSDKQRKGALRLEGTPGKWTGYLSQWGIDILPIETDIIERFHAEGIPESQERQHKDPFDRLIISTALLRHLTLISADRKFPWWQRYRKLSLQYIGK